MHLSKGLPRLAVTVAALIMLTTGCVKLDTDLDVHSDDTVSGTVIVALDKSLASKVKSNEPDTFTPPSRSELPPGADAAEWADDTYQGFKITYNEVRLADLNKVADANASATGAESWRGGFRITHDDGDYTFTWDLSDLGTVSANGGADQVGSASARRALRSADTRAQITFPGKVEKTNGTVGDDGRTVTWRPKLGSSNLTLRAVAKDSTFPWRRAIGSGLIGLAVVIVVAMAARTWRGGRARHPR